MSPSLARLVMLLAALPVVPSLACRRAPGGAHAVTLAGSTSLQPLAEKWADAYGALRPEMLIQVQGGGSTAGIQAALSDVAQIGMSSRSLTGDEARHLVGVPVARDGIAVIVHPTSPVHDLGLDQVRAIYAGDLRTWRALGGRDLAITVITREEGSGTRAAFEDLVMAGRRILGGALVQDSTGGVRQMVASDPAAIGYVSLGLVDASVRPLRIRGVAPAEETIDAGTYPLVRPFLFVLHPPRTTPAAADFVAWISGPEGRRITRAEGLLPARP